MLDGSLLSPPSFRLNNFKDLLIVMFMFMCVPLRANVGMGGQSQGGQRSSAGPGSAHPPCVWAVS